MSKSKISSLPINIEKRWEKGIPHHPKAEKLARLIAEIDYHHNHDSMCIKFGGDGDTGEDLCYILSEIFERKLI